MDRRIAEERFKVLRASSICPTDQLNPADKAQRSSPLGNTGSSVSDEERVALWAEARVGTLIGQVVEVNFMERPGKFAVQFSYAVIHDRLPARTT